MANVLQWNQNTNSFSVSGATSVTPVVGEGIDNNFSVAQTFGAGILQTGAAGAGNQSPLLNVGDAFSDFIASGVQWAIPSSASLTTSMTSGSAYLNSVRTLVPAISGNAFPASNDTYVSFDNAGTPAYQSVANGATAPTSPSGYVQTAKVVTSPIVSPGPSLTPLVSSGTLALGDYEFALVSHDATGYGAVSTAVSGSISLTAPTPVFNYASFFSTSGTLAAGTYTYGLVAHTATGYSILGTTTNVVTTETGAVTFTWTLPTGVTSVDVYGRVSGSIGLLASGITATTWTDNGSATVGAAPPATATATGEMVLNWTNSINTTSVDIYATPVGSTTLGLLASGVTATTYTHTGATTPGALPPAGSTSNAIQSTERLLPIGPQGKFDHILPNARLSNQNYIFNSSFLSGILGWTIPAAPEQNVSVKHNGSFSYLSVSGDVGSVLYIESIRFSSAAIISGDTITLSGWVKSSVANAGFFVACFNSSGAFITNVMVKEIPNPSSDFQFMEISGTVASGTASVNIGFIVPPGAGSEYEVGFSQLKLEVGEIATHWSDDATLSSITGISVEAFGAQGNGNTDDTAALKSGLGGNNGEIFLSPNKQYLISEQISLSGNDLLEGSGFTSTILGTAGLGNLLALNNNSSIKDFALTCQAPTSGSALTTGTLSNFIENIFISNAYTAFTSNGTTILRGAVIHNYTYEGMNIRPNSRFFTQINMFNGALDANGVGTGVVLNGHLGGLVFTDSEVIGGASGLTVTPVSTTVPPTSINNGPAFNRFSNVFFDSSTNGAIIDWSTDTIWDACWFSNRPGNGATVGTNYAQGMVFLGSTFENCGSHGLAIEANAVNTTVLGCIVKGNNTENNGSYGIYVAPGTKGFTIKDNIITSQFGGVWGTQAAAIYIGAGCDDYIIEGNYVLGNAATIIDESRFTATNRIVRGNTGYQEPKNINWLANSSFDYGMQGWTLLQQGGIWSIGTDQPFNYLNYTVSSGTATFYPESAIPITNAQAVTAGNIVCLSFWAQNLTGGAFALYLGLYDGSTFVENKAITPVTSSTWGFYKNYLTIPSGITSIIVGIDITQVFTGTNVSVGQIKVESGASPTEWSDESSSELLTNGTFDPSFGVTTVAAATSSVNAPNLGQTNSLYQSSKLAVASTTTSGSITASAAQLAEGFLADGATQTAAFTVTTDTATNILAAMPDVAIGSSFQWRFINNDQSSTGYAGTLAGGTGVTVGSVLPNPAVPKGAYMDYLFTFTAVGSSPTLTVEAVGGNSSALL
jgi:hypothetical protein